MKNISKKIIIYSMVGIMQIGAGIGILEASPGGNHNQQPYEQEQGPRGHEEQERHDKERREKERHERQEQENRRHKQEMERHRGENERDWHERQRREQERHDENIKRIAQGVLELILDN